MLHLWLPFQGHPFVNPTLSSETTPQGLILEWQLVVTNNSLKNSAFSFSHSRHINYPSYLAYNFSIFLWIRHLFIVCIDLDFSKDRLRSELSEIYFKSIFDSLYIYLLFEKLFVLGNISTTFIFKDKIIFLCKTSSCFLINR